MLILLLLLIPFASAIVAAASSVSTAKNIALGSSVLSLAIAAYAAFALSFKSGLAAVSFSQIWIGSLGIKFSLSLDGISMIMVLLTNLLLPFILASIKTEHKPSLFHALALFMQGALLGVFMADDGFLFYVFWELALLPIYFICLGWGAEGRQRITFKFFLYTLSGSLFMLVSLLFLYLQTPGNHSFLIQDLMIAGHSLPADAQTLVFWGLFLAFAIKIPIFPFHTWQPDTYTNAPASGTMLLSGIMLKMGLYGIMRWLLPMVPDAVAEWSDLAIGLSVIGIVYASLIAMVQNDFKRLVAYSSIAHVGLIAAGSFALNGLVFQGALMQMLSHGITVLALFYLIELLERRTQTRALDSLGGIRTIAPVYSTIFLIVLMGSVALPLTSGFVGEFLLLNGLYQHSAWFAAFAGLTIILGAVYMLGAYRKAMLGTTGKSSSSFADLGSNELVVLLPLSALVILLGLYPRPLLEISGPAVEILLKNCQPGPLAVLN